MKGIHYNILFRMCTLNKSKSNNDFFFLTITFTHLVVGQFWMKLG